MADGYGPIANQRINTYTTIKLSNGDSKQLQSGTFVKYVSKGYLPKDNSFGDYDESYWVAVFSPYGIGLVQTTDVDWNVY